MKRSAVFLLCILLLAGCTFAAPASSTPTQVVPTPTQAAQTEPTDPQQRLAWRRDVVEAYMRHMMSLRWKIPNAVSYSANNTSKGLEADSAANEGQIVRILSNQVYQGIPYTHGGGSGYSFLALAGEPDENGVYTLTGLTRELLSGYSGSDLYNTSRLGNDCADAIFWAWAQVSNTIAFPYTNCMIPAYGCVKVGDYDSHDTPYTGNTSEICNQNRQQRMFEAYACLQKGDALVRTVNSAGHAIMAVSVQVERTQTGQIDGERSCLIYLDQDLACEVNTTSYEDQTLGTVLLCEELDKKKSFAELFSVGYLPVTCKELVDSAPLPQTVVTDSVEHPDATNLFTGVIQGSYRIAYVTVRITDENDQTVQQATCFSLQEDMYQFDLRRFANEAEQRVMLGSIDLQALEEGSYRCSFSCRMSNGRILTFRDFPLEISGHEPPL